MPRGWHPIAHIKYHFAIGHLQMIRVNCECSICTPHAELHVQLHVFIDNAVNSMYRFFPTLKYLHPEQECEFNFY